MAAVEGHLVGVGKEQVVDAVPKVIKEIQFGVLYYIQLMKHDLKLTLSQVKSRHNQPSSS